MMKGEIIMKKTGLQKKILRFLLTGSMVLIPLAGHAETVDMTAPENAGGVVISDPTEDFTASYLYKWDTSTEQLIGGNIKITSNKEKQYISPSLVVKAENFMKMTPADIQKITDKVKEKIHNSVAKQRWRVSPQVKIIDEKGGETTVLRKYDVQFEDKHSEHPTKFVLSGGEFHSVLQNNGAPDSEYEWTAEGYWLTPSGEYTIRPMFAAADDHVYAALRSSNRVSGVTNMEGSSTYMPTLTVIADASSLPDSEAYGIYANTASPVLFSTGKGTVKVKGTQAVGVYAGNTGTKPSEVALRGNITFDLNGDTTVGLKAGKNGVITNHPKARDDERMMISSPKGAALYAYDGGKIELKNMAITAAGKDAIIANTGGKINIGKVNGIVGNIVTDNHADSHINVTVGGTFIGDVVGHVDLRMQGGKWTGNSASDGKTELNGAQWTGSFLHDNGSLHIRNSGLWNIKSSATDDVTLTKFVGGDTPGIRGYVNMSGNKLHIKEYSGHGTFVYQHGTENVADIIGGDLTIEAAKPLVVVSEGMGEKKETITSESPSSITVATPIDGIDTTDAATVEKVLANLAAKLTYANYAKGERQLSGTAEIQEGLTAASISKYLSELVFDESTGKAGIGKIFAPYTSSITGYAPDDQAYADVYDAEKSVFNFTKDTYILEKKTKDHRQMAWGAFYYGLVNNFGKDLYHGGFGAKSAAGPSYTMDMHGHNLDIDLAAFPEAGTTGSQPMWTSAAIMAAREGTITINNPGKINLTSNANYYYGSVIRASSAQPTPTGAHVVINNDQGNLADHVVTMRGGIDSPGYEMNYRTLETFRNKDAEYKNDNSITIKGLVDIKSRYGASVFARGGNITLGGGRIEAEKYDAVWTVGKGQVNINVITDENGKVTSVGKNDFVLYGNAAAATDYYGYGGTINLAFTTANSLFEGQMYGSNNPSLNLWLQNGARWNNIPQLFHPWSGPEAIRDRSSLITSLHGGDSAETAGDIYQTSKEKIEVENFSGYANFFMKHNPDDVANFGHIGGLSIHHAVQTDNKNASVTLITDALSKADLEEEDTVKAVLNGMANKLYYLGYIDGERHLDAKAQIAEGLTSYSAAWIKRGNVAFQEADGQGILAADKVETNPHPQEGPRADVVYVGKDDTDKTMRHYYAGDKQLYIYKHNAENPSEVYGGGVVIGHADKGAQIRLRTDNDGIDIHDADKVRDVLNGLAGKLTYKRYVDGERNLTGTAEIAEGLTAYSALMKFGTIKYRQESGQGYFGDARDIRTPDGEIIYGPKETAMMRGAKSAMTGAMLTWREESNDLGKRLGDVRFGNGDTGAWGRIYGGKVKYDKDNADYQTKFKAVQVGYDKILRGNWKAGLAFSYIDGDNTYRLGGNGTTTVASLAVYGTKVNQDGSYLDVVAKGGRVNTDYTVYNDLQNKLEGNYRTNGMVLSAECGKKMSRGNGVYFVPQLELIYSKLVAQDYDAKSDYAGGKVMHVEQGDFDSLIGRAGVSIGKETAGTNLYAKLSVLHEWKGKVATTYQAAGEPTSVTEQDFGDTWLVVGLGGTHQLSDTTYLYGSLERSFGGDVETEWRADLGMRWMF